MQNMYRKTRGSSFAALAALFLAGLFSSNTVQAQAFSENFDNVPAIFTTGGWVEQQRSNPVGTATWFQGNPASFPAFSGATDSYIGGNFNATDGGTGVISLWLFSPSVTMNNGDTIRFYTRRSGSIYDDNLQVRINPTGGAGTNVGTTETSVGDYSQLLLDINPTLNGSYPGVWTEYVVLVSGLTGPTTARVAFRYNVPSLAGPAGDNSDYIGIDDFSFTPSGTGATADATLISFVGEYSMIPRIHTTAMPIGATARNVGSLAATSVSMEANVFSSSNGFATPIQTTTSNTVASLAAGANAALTAGTFSPPDTGVYVIQYTVTATNDGNTTNNTIIYPFVVTDSAMARDDAAFNNPNGNTIGLASATQTVKLGALYTTQQSSVLSSAAFLLNDIEVGDTLWAVAHNFTAGAIAAATLHQSAPYIVQAADTVGWGPNTGLITIPFSPGPVLATGTYFIGVEKAQTNAAIYVFRTDAIYTANTNFFNIDNGAFNSADGIIQEAMYIRPNFQPNCSVTSSVSTLDETCTNAAGLATVSAANGTAPYSYLWATGETTDVLAGISAGSYFATVTDANGCESFATATVGSISTNLNATSAVTATGCGVSTGEVAITAVTNGTAPYSYLWNTGATTTSLSNLSTGLYNFTVTDANGCQGTGSQTVNTATGPSATLSQSQTPLCPNGDDGSIDISVTGGTAPYTFVWSSGETSQNLSDLPAGNYTLTVSDDLGCDFILGPVAITNPAGITVTASTADAGCTTADGSVTSTVSGGTAPYSYEWSNGATMQNLAAVPAGTYRVTVVDANGCEEISSIFTVGTVGGPTLSSSATAANCAGSADGSVNLTVGGGTTPYSFAWSNGETTQDLSNIPAGTYTVTLSDAAGCDEVETVTVQDGDSPTVGLSATGLSASGASDGSISATVSGGATPYSFAWSNGATTQDLNGLAAGSYTVTVTDANGCTRQATETISPATAINAIPGLLSVELFPNPTNGEFSISLKLDQSQDVSMQLFNITGQLLISQEFELVQEAVLPVSIENFPAGMYYVRLRIGSEFITQKVIRR